MNAEIVETLVLSVHVLMSLGIIGLVLIQQGKGAVLSVQSQTCLTGLVVRAMTGKTMIREDRFDIAIEVDVRRTQRGSADQGNHPNTKGADETKRRSIRHEFTQLNARENMSG